MSASLILPTWRVLNIINKKDVLLLCCYEKLNIGIQQRRVIIHDGKWIEYYDSLVGP